MARTRTGQPELVCYCPASVAALAAATRELTQARGELQRHDPNWNAINELVTATAELRKARELLERLTRKPELDGQARELLARLQAAMPALERIEAIIAALDNAEVIAWR